MDQVCEILAWLGSGQAQQIVPFRDTIPGASRRNDLTVVDRMQEPISRKRNNPYSLGRHAGPFTELPLGEFRDAQHPVLLHINSLEQCLEDPCGVLVDEL